MPVTARSDARYCSPACRQKAYRARRGGIPASMRDRARWVRHDARKRPLTATGRPASVTDPGTWSSYAEVSRSKHGTGVGVVLGDGLGCIDLDHCISDGVIAPWAQAVLDANPDTFTEISQSGAGIHLWGSLPEGKGRVIRDGRNIEIYSAGRFIALGTPMRGTSTALRPLVIPE